MTDNGDIAAVLVAAGESRRMGATNKLALTIEGEPLLRRTARQLLASRVSEVVVVLGHAADWAEHALSGLPVRCVRNVDYQKGQVGSVNTGLANVPTSCAGVMIALADMPLLTADDYNALIDSYTASAEHPVLVPFFKQQRGNPVIIGTTLVPTILAGGLKLGCRGFIDAHPELVDHFDAPNHHYIRDVDTPDDYTALIQETAHQ